MQSPGRQGALVKAAYSDRGSKCMSEKVYWLLSLSINPGQFENLKTLMLLKDEMPVANLNGQLAMFAELSDQRANRLPDAFVFWRWANAFELIATFSILWKPSLWKRVYFPLSDPRLEILLSEACLLVLTEPVSNEVLSIFEVFPGEFDLPEGREDYLKHQMLSIGDVDAAKHWVYWRLSKPKDAGEQLQASFIEIRHTKVREAIECIEKNRFRETIPAEAERMTEAGWQFFCANHVAIGKRVAVAP